MGFICEAQVPCLTADNVCLNNGSCWVNNGRVLCTCPPGYQGVLCEQLIDNCDSVPCLHGGDCINKVNNYTCNCTEFYTGRNCETSKIEVFAKSRIPTYSTRGLFQGLPNQYETAITTVLAIAISIVGFLLVTLCIMDLPWEDIMKVWQKRKATKLAKSEAVISPELINNTQSQMPSKAQLLASEQEMLRRFRSALEQTKSARTPRSRTNVH